MWFDYGKNQPAAPEKIEFTDSRFQDVNERFLLYRVLPIEPRTVPFKMGGFTSIFLVLLPFVVVFEGMGIG